MKLKCSKEGISLKKLFPVMYAVTVLLVVIRTFQLTRYIDSETGFLTGGEALYAVFLVIVVAAALFFAVASYLSSESKSIELVGLEDKGCGIAAAVFAVSLAYDSFSSIADSFVIFDKVPASAFDHGAELFKTLMATGALPYSLQSLFALISAVYLFVLAKSFLKGSQRAHNRKYIALAPVAWAAFKIITRFVKQISYIRVSDLFLELIMLAFMILFFVALAQTVSGVYCDDSCWRITGLGLSGAFLSLGINIPRLVLTVFANDFVNKEYPFNPADTAFAVFAIFVAVAAVKSSKKALD